MLKGPFFGGHSVYSRLVDFFFGGGLKDLEAFYRIVNFS